MENADEVMITAIRELGVSIDSEITSFKDFTTEILMSTVSVFLNLIDKSNDLPTYAPASGSEKFRNSTNLSQLIKVLLLLFWSLSFFFYGENWF
jgi:hypothetical protein